MSELVRGATAILNRPAFYNLFQKIIGAPRMRATVTGEFIRPRNGDRILDIGCGPADILEQLSPIGIRYHGLDTSAQYVEFARTRWGNHRFDVTSVENGYDVTEAGSYDIVIAIGVLHHLEDEEVIALTELAHSRLKSGGRLVTADPVYLSDMTRVERWLADNDRGKNIRTEPDYVRLIRSTFRRAIPTIKRNMANIPARALVIEATKEEAC